MYEKIQHLLRELENLTAKNLQEAEELRIKWIGKKGCITALFDEFKTIAADRKRDLGQPLNALKNAAQEKLLSLRTALTQEAAPVADDYTQPGEPHPFGARHPISTVRAEIIEIFARTGYTLAEGPEIEDDWHVFSALNFPPEHPARDMQDTFFVRQGNNPVLLRTHTSSVQVRVMESQPPPIRVICPGRVFRNEAVSARAHCIFHQVEGLYIDENVSFADLKQAVLYFAREMFGHATKIRLRPSYFPFTEPSAEVDVSCNICGGKGCAICKHTGWLEIMGCGMVDPNVLATCRIDPEKYTGFAFGMGVERIAMLKWQVRDLRLYFENDVRFLAQFAATV
ncbi:MAG: phenylalanine--tRNA ligase subunit alpha [Prevotellaceae bacterium]|jgi:phenylalanyl-tRNA synthetase alpha chain|nr:phenylalanine--tRNA ligase subunit alpha [Prevotellaceae bacterium]